MSLITAATVKTKWPTWETFAQAVVITGQTNDQKLQTAIDLAEEELQSYFDTLEDADDMTTPLTFHLMRIIKKHLFDMKHGDTQFKNKPQIIKDYEATIKKLSEGLTGSGLIDLSGARDRIMDEGFVDSENVWYDV